MKDMFEYITKNRILKLEEYNDEGKLIDVRESSEQDMFHFAMEQINESNCLSIIRSEDLNRFSQEELKIIDALIIIDNKSKWFTEYKAENIRKLLDETDINILRCTLNLMKPLYWGNHIFNNDESHKYDFTLKEMIDFIKNRDGIYYTINTQGEREYDFIDKPTKRQVEYHRITNGTKTVFLSFNDWKEHIINENRL